jgi:thioester reductase-like protein
VTTYFVTGATGFLGRRLMAKLLARPGCDAVYVLVRPGSHDKLTALVEQWPRGAVIGVHGDLAEPGLGIDSAELPPPSTMWCTWAPCTTSPPARTPIEPPM